jgi:hypothetical protein
MSYSNRPSKRPDPTARPTDAPFSPSLHQERKRELAAAKRRRNRQGIDFHGRIPNGRQTS